MKDKNSFFDCTQPKFLISNKNKNEKNKSTSKKSYIFDKLEKTQETSRRKNYDNGNLIFPEIPLNPEKNKFVLYNINNNDVKIRNYNSIDALSKHSKILRPGYSRLIILDKLKNDNDSNSYSSRKSLKKYPKEVTVKNLPIFENISNNDMVTINFPSLDNPSKRRIKKLPLASNNSEREMKNILLRSICKDKKNSINKNENINPQLGNICYSSRNIRLGSKYCKFQKADDAEDWNRFNDKLKDMYEKDRLKKIRIKKPILRNCYEYLEYARKKKNDEFGGKIHETVKKMLIIKEKFNKLFNNARSEKLGEWKNDDDEN